VISTGEWERALGCIPPQSSRRTAASLPVAFGLARSFSLACFSSRSQRTAAARYLSHSLPFPSLIETTSTTTMSAGPFNELVEETWTRVQELMSSTDGWAPISTVRARWLFVVDWSARALDRVQRHFSLTVWCAPLCLSAWVCGVVTSDPGERARQLPSRAAWLLDQGMKCASTHREREGEIVVADTLVPYPRGGGGARSHTRNVVILIMWSLCGRSYALLDVPRLPLRPSRLSSGARPRRSSSRYVDAAITPARRPGRARRPLKRE